MGIVFVIIAVTAFAVQGVLFTKYVRKYSATQVAYIRNISMIFTGLPLLYFSPHSLGYIITHRWYRIALAGAVGATHVVVAYMGYNNIPFGIAKTIKNGSKTISVLILSLFFLAETFTTWEGVSLAIIVGGCFALSIHKIDIHHLPHARIGKGLAYVILAGVLAALSWYFFIFYSQEIGSITSAYILESSVGLIYLFPFLRGKMTHQKQQKVETKDIVAMSSIGLITYIGTVCMALAFHYDGFGMASLLQNVGVIISVLFARLLFKEKITWKQGLLILIVLGGIVMLKMR